MMLVVSEEKDPSNILWDGQQPSKLQDTEWVKTEISVSGRLYAGSRRLAFLGLPPFVSSYFC